MLETGQYLGTQLKAAIAPQLMQSIKLAAMPALELRDEILKEAEKNPALEVVSDPATATVPPRKRDASYRESAPYPAAGGRDGEEKSRAHRDFFEKVLFRAETLQEHLNSQVSELKLSTEAESLARAVISCLDGNGFLAVPPETLPGASDAALLDEALSAVRRLDPAGCAARDSLHSLAIQARLRSEAAKDSDDKKRYSLLASILNSEAMLEGKAGPESLAAAAKREGCASVSAKEAARLMELLRGLEPYPGRNFAQGEVAGEGAAQLVVPDIIVAKRDGVFHARVNDDEIPVVRVSPAFERFAKEGARGKEGLREREDAAFVRESLKSARLFIDSLERRRKTLLKVAAVVIARQRPFFERGPKFLLPLRMLDAAKVLGFHEATVSRAVSGKYLQCEWGVFSLRYFFSSGTKAAGADGEGKSKESVKEIIREMLEGSGKRPSDREIAERLAQRGIQIARRTVAKYRGEIERRT